MTDTNGDGWTPGSTLTVSIEGLDFGTFRLVKGYTSSGLFSLAGHLLPNSEWKYANVPQTTTEWTTASVSWNESYSFPDVTSITRYYRKSISVSKIVKLFKASVTTDSGFRFYVNGHVLYEWNLPNTTVSSSTYALSSTSLPVDRTFSSVVGALFCDESGDSDQVSDESDQVSDENDQVKEETDSIIVNNDGNGSSISDDTNNALNSTLTLEIAIEVHATSDTLLKPDTFNCYVFFTSENDRDLVDSEGWYEADPPTAGVDGAAMLFDGTTTTQWSFRAASPFVARSVWHFGEGARRLMNKYSLSAGETLLGASCVQWKVYGSDDSSQWFLLDHQDGVVWSAVRETKTFRVANFYAFRAYKLECLETSVVDAFQMSEWDLLLSEASFQQPRVQYASAAFTWTKDTERVSVYPTQAGFAQWEIAGPSGVALPTGLVFSQEDGSFSGIPRAALPRTPFTISAVFVGDSTRYATTLTLCVREGLLPGFLPLVVTKTNYPLEDETWRVVDANGATVLASTSRAPVVSTSAPLQDYYLVMTSTTSQGWASSSFLTLSTRVGGRVVTLERLRLGFPDEETVLFSLDLPLKPAAVSSFRYLADGTLPAHWAETGFDDSAWSVLDDAARPTTNRTLTLVRAHFALASTAPYQGFELHLKARAGVVVFINGHEVYRRYLQNPIAETSTPTGGSATAKWRSVTGVRSVLRAENVIAVLLVEDMTPRTLDVDMFIRMLGASHTHCQYWDYSVSTNTYAEAAYLFDEDPSTHVVVPKVTDASSTFTLQFHDERVQLFNKYCVTSGSETAQADPRSWRVKGSNDGVSFVTLKEEEDVVFDARSHTLCFFMPSNAQPFSSYQLEVVDTASPSSLVLALADWNLYLEDLDAQTASPLAFSPSVLVGYVGVSFPGTVCSSSLYTSFSITPALPEGVSLFTNTGVIQGVPVAVSPATVYTVRATNHLGEAAEATLTLSVEECPAGKVGFSLSFSIDASAAACSYALKDRATDTVIDERHSFLNHARMTIPFCRSPSTFALVLRKNDTSGWGSNRVSVVLADGSVLLTESLAAGVTEKEYAFNPTFVVAPKHTVWHYLVSGAEPPAGWTERTTAPAWETSVPGAFPASEGTTQYFYTVFEVASLVAFASLDVTVMVKGGAVVYLNGVELRRYNLPDDTITASTRATAESVVPAAVITGEYVQRGVLVEGQNKLAIELHSYKTAEASSSFDASAILVLDNMYMVRGGAGSTRPSKEGINGSDKAFDNNSSTETILDEGCVGAVLLWKYHHNRQEPITNYALVSGSACNIHAPSGWSFFGSVDGENWLLLQQKSGQFFTSYREQRRFDVLNAKPFSMYKLQVTECANPTLSDQDTVAACGSAKLRLTDFHMFAKRIEADFCEASGDYAAAMNGDYSYATCPDRYEGYRFRLCTNSTFGEETDNCSPKEPVGIVYEKERLVLMRRKTMTPFAPRVIAVDYAVLVQPSLPSGMALDKATGTISGTPVRVQKKTLYTVTVTNVGGSASTTLEIEIVASPTNWFLIVLSVIDGLLIVLVFVIIVRISKKRKQRREEESKPSADSSDSKL